MQRPLQHPPLKHPPLPSNICPKFMPAEEVVVVGRLGSPYGVQGWLNLQSFTTPPENLLAYQPWFVQKQGGGEWLPLIVAQCRPHKKSFVAQLQGIADRDEAAAMTGSLIGVKREVLPAPDTLDEHYWSDLVGCRVVTEAGVELGEVDHLLETGAHDVLVVRAGRDRPGSNEHLIPFANEFVKAVDVDTRTITVAWDPEW